VPADLQKLFIDPTVLWAYPFPKSSPKAEKAVAAGSKVNRNI
jgi:hypothetical protein